MATSRDTRKSTARKSSSGRSASRAKSVVLRLAAPDATMVTIAGEFNDWDPRAHPMKRENEDTWKVSLRLKPGSYQYKFVVDGEWWEDRANPKHVVLPDGIVNSVVEVT